MIGTILKRECFLFDAAIARLGLFEFGGNPHLFEKGLGLPDLLQLVLDGHTILGQTLSQSRGRLE